MSEDATPTDGSAPTLRTLTDPASLADRPDVTLETEADTAAATRFDHWREKAGLVGAGVTTESGDLLLWDGPHGWTLPYAEVDTGGDFAGRAREILGELLGLTPALVGAERLTRIDLAHADTDATTTTWQVVFRTAPVADETAAELAAGDPDLQWVSSMDDEEIAGEQPDDVEAEVDDVRRFLE